LQKYYTDQIRATDRLIDSVRQDGSALNRPDRDLVFGVNRVLATIKSVLATIKNAFLGGQRELAAPHDREGIVGAVYSGFRPQLATLIGSLAQLKAIGVRC
jgi:hypothetical protein